MNKLLVVGNGGREHALTWKLANDSSRPEVFCAPGNAGTASIATNVDLKGDDLDGICAWARENRPDLTVVGPEAPLCAGLTDRLEADGLAVFGPRSDGARVEGSKLFAKEVMQGAGVPTARAVACANAEEALAAVREQGTPVVIKADGLAAGKGVFVCADEEAAREAIEQIMVSRVFGDSGNRVLVEECLQGEEASILALVDGEHMVLLASSQDHKRAYNDDAGPNTGGMGAYSPAPIIGERLWPVVRERIMQPTVAELRRRGIVYRGVLYAGLMLTPEGPQVLEFNCRFGDPETQAVIPRLSGDLLPALKACADGTLSDSMIEWRSETCVCVVMASGGYPGHYEKGKLISGLDDANALAGVTVFHAGTRLRDGDIVTDGGRVLGVAALGDSLQDAVDRSYEGISLLSFDQAQYRTDIAGKAL